MFPARQTHQLHHDRSLPDSIEHRCFSPSSSASKLPRTGSHLGLTACRSDLETLFTGPGTATKLDHFLYHDRPQVALRVDSFTDATIVTLRAPHTLCDLRGSKDLLEAWSLILQGRADQVAPTYPDDADPLADFGRHPTEPHRLAGFLLSGLQLLKFIIFNFSWALWSNTFELRTICVPASTLASLREAALQHLAADKANGTEQPPFLSEGDVLIAWWAKLTLRTDASRLVAINCAMSFHQLSRDLLSLGTYFSNTLFILTVLIPAADFRHKPLGYVASQIRRSLVDTVPRPQIEAHVALWRAAASPFSPIFGSPMMQFLTCTNWSKGASSSSTFPRPSSRGRPSLDPPAESASQATSNPSFTV